MMLQEKAENRPTVDQLLEDERIDVDGEELEGGEENTSVLILGGCGYFNTIYLLDSNALSWKKLSITLPVERENFGAVVLNEEIYIFGGNSKDDYQQDSYKLKNDGSWERLRPLNQRRTFICSSSLVYKGDIWVIGGDSGDSRSSLKSVERYDISQDSWTNMPEMNYPRSRAAAAVFNGQIYVTGGWNYHKLDSMEMFDPELQKWILFCDLPFGLYGHTMLINDSNLSIFGGHSGSRSLNSIWEMNIEDLEKEWTEMQGFKQPRDSFGIGNLSNGIIVFGGVGEVSGKTSEIFDGNKWIEGPKLPQKLSSFAYTSIPRSLEKSFLKKFEKQNTSILILGGYGSLNTIYLFDSKARSWKKLGITLPVKMQDFGAVEVNEEIYIFGGYSNNKCQRCCYKLKVYGSWMELNSMKEKRSDISSSSLVYKGDIWVIGGSGDSENLLKSVERYDILQNEWTYMPEMNNARRYAAAAVFKDRIFVTGGTMGERSVEIFDPKPQKWILFCNLPFEVRGHTMLINNSTLSIFGGCSGSDILNSVWEMDIEDPEKKWTQKRSFKYPRACFGIGKLSNEIIVFGGWEENAETSEIFDGNKWIYGPILPQKLSSFAYTSIPRFLEESFLKKFS